MQGSQSHLASNSVGRNGRSERRTSARHRFWPPALSGVPIPSCARRVSAENSEFLAESVETNVSGPRRGSVWLTEVAPHFPAVIIFHKRFDTTGPVLLVSLKAPVVMRAIRGCSDAWSCDGQHVRQAVAVWHSVVSWRVDTCSRA